MRPSILAAFPRADQQEWLAAGRGPPVWDSNAVL